jgi:hypothetical protein
VEHAREPVARGALFAALSEYERAETQRSQLARLAGSFSMNGRLIELPFVFADHIGREELERLADALAVQL